MCGDRRAVARRCDRDVRAERQSTDSDDVLQRLERELVGLGPVKARIREIADLLVVDRRRRRFGIESSRPTLHMCFTGSPGTAKTTVALRMAELLHGLGYLSSQGPPGERDPR